MTDEEKREEILRKKREWYHKNKEKIKEKSIDRSEYHKEWYQKNKEKLSEKYQDNKEEVLEKRKEFYNIPENKEKRSEYNKKHKIENSEHYKEYQSNYYQENKEELSEKNKEYISNNKERYKKYQREYMSKRLNSDDLFKLSKNIRCLVKKSFLIKNKTKTTDILGCSIEEFKIHLESKFEDWMTWENWGLYNGELNYGWDIDHNIPLSSAKTEEEVLELSHYTNLQPLCSKVNRYIKKNLPKDSSCLSCGIKLEYVKYCNDNCRKKYHRLKNKQ